MTKQIERQLILNKLSTMEPQVKSELENKLLEKLVQHEFWQKANNVAVTLSQPIELNSEPIIKKAWDSGKKVFVPRTLPEREMEFVHYTPNTKMERTKFGILEPICQHLPVDKKEIDLILVPGVAFKQNGYRIGFGAGYYDRYLANYKGNTLSLAFPIQLTEEWATDEFDIPVQVLLT